MVTCELKILSPSHDHILSLQAMKNNQRFEILKQNVMTYAAVNTLLWELQIALTGEDIKANLRLLVLSRSSRDLEHFGVDDEAAGGWLEGGRGSMASGTKLCGSTNRSRTSFEAVYRQSCFVYATKLDLRLIRILGPVKGEPQETVASKFGCYYTR